jgi:hypothetical protein
LDHKFSVLSHGSGHSIHQISRPNFWRSMSGLPTTRLQRNLTDKNAQDLTTAKALRLIDPHPAFSSFRSTHRLEAR